MIRILRRMRPAIRSAQPAEAASAYAANCRPGKIPELFSLSEILIDCMEQYAISKLERKS
jgi:hypothetical protein